jgi:DNA repair exonuclease SbcCD ATPase subunit
MENQDILMLNDVLEHLKRKENELNKTKESLDRVKVNVEQINTKEVEFRNLYSRIEKIQTRLKQFLGKTKAECLTPIEESTKNIWSRYQMEVAKVENGMKNDRFSEARLQDYRSYITKFLSDEINNLDKAYEKQKEIFEKSREDIGGKMEMLKRLLASLSRKIEEIKTIKDFITRIETEKHSLQVPTNLDELLQIPDEKINELYVRTIETIDALREEVKHFIVANKLLSEEEITVLELLHQITPPQLDFVSVLTRLKETSRTSEEKLQDILFGLSKKGFITLRIIL